MHEGSPVDLSSTSEEALVKTSLVMGSQKRASWAPAFLVLGSCARIHHAFHPLHTRRSCVQMDDAPSSKQTLYVSSGLPGILTCRGFTNAD